MFPGPPAGPVFAVEVVASAHTRKRARRTSRPMLKQTSPGKKKERFEQREADSDQEGEQPSPSRPPSHYAAGTPRQAEKTPLVGSRPVDLLPHNVQRGPRPSNASGLEENEPLKDLARATPTPPLLPLCFRTPVKNPFTNSEVPALPLKTPGRDRMDARQRCLSPPRDSTTAVEFDEEIIPTSQSQDLRPFVVSPPRPGGTVLLKDTTPKPLRQSQGYIDQPLQPLPSLLAVIHARDYAQPQEDGELWTPRSLQSGDSFGTPAAKSDKAAPGHNELPSSERTGVFETPTKLAGVSRGEKANVMR